MYVGKIVGDNDFGDGFTDGVNDGMREGIGEGCEKEGITVGIFGFEGFMVGS